MAELGAYYITIMPSMKGFTTSVNKSLKGLGSTGASNYSSGFMATLKGSAIGTVLGTLATKAGSSIVSGLKTGIDRADTLRNFPRVMEAMGYSADDAEAGIKKIMDRLRGLPASTQDVVRLTQAIADSTGDLGLATDGALAFTDAMIANGASAGEVTQAQGVLNRVLGKQNATTAQWQSLVSVMPTQLGAAAEAILGEGHSVEELREKLNDGTVSWNDFLRKLVELDTEGNGHMKSFYEQAKANSDGIGTAIENMGWRIGTGWASIINAIGVENISKPINDTADLISGAMGGIGNSITDLKERLADNGAFDNMKVIMESLNGAFEGFSGTISGALDAAVPIIADLIDKALQWLVDHGEEISSFLGGIAEGFGRVAGDIGGLAAFFAPLAEDFIGKSLQWILDHGDVVAASLGGIATGMLAFKTAQTAVDVVLAMHTALELIAMMGPLSALADLPTMFVLLAETGGPLAPMFGALGSALGFLAANPIVLAVGAIALITGAIATWVTQTEEGQKAWDDFCKGLADLAEGLKRDIKGAFDQIKRNLEDNKVQWETFKTNVGNAVEGIKTRVITVVTGTIERVKQDWKEAKDSVLKVFDDMKKGIGDTVDRIKGLFDFSWSLPEPKMPHITWGWESVGGLLSIPTFSIDWYAKGGVFNSATLIGVGEAGKEAALPLNQQTYREMAAGIVSEMGERGDAITIEKLADTIIIEKTADVDEVLERINTMTRRQREAMA